MKKIIEYFPDKLRGILYEQIKDKDNELEEIRIRNEKPIILKFNKEENIIKYNVNSRQVIGCSSKLLKYILNLENNSIFNTLIVSPPGYGKTTILKDVARQISSGNEELNFKGITVGIVDERSEIASLYKGVPQNDVGIKTDIIENVSKSIGMRILVRSMAPKVIIADEIGIPEDVDAINYSLCSGCKGIFTAHGSNFNDICLNPVLKNLLDLHCFECLIFLDEVKRGYAKDVFILNKDSLEYEKIDE